MTKEKTQYVVGFLLNEAMTRCTMIIHVKPEWMAGKLNGLGGHVELGETPAEAMRREFLEETGTWAFDYPDWELFATVEGNSHLLYCFRGWSPAVENIRVTDGPEGLVGPVSLPLAEEPEPLHDVRWLTEMARSGREGSGIPLPLYIIEP